MLEVSAAVAAALGIGLLCLSRFRQLRALSAAACSCLISQLLCAVSQLNLHSSVYYRAVSCGCGTWCIACLLIVDTRLPHLKPPWLLPCRRR